MYIYELYILIEPLIRKKGSNMDKGEDKSIPNSINVFYTQKKKHVFLFYSNKHINSYIPIEYA